MYISKSFCYETKDIFISLPEYLEKEYAIDLLYDLNKVIYLGDSYDFQYITQFTSADSSAKAENYKYKWIIYDEGDWSVGISGSSAIFATNIELSEGQVGKIRNLFEEYNDFATYMISSDKLKEDVEPSSFEFDKFGEPVLNHFEDEYPKSEYPKYTDVGII